MISEFSGSRLGLIHHVRQVDSSRVAMLKQYVVLQSARATNSMEAATESQ